jgi:arylsulfatase A-like enzyme
MNHNNVFIYLTGMQGLPMLADEPRALPLYERLMPQYFQDLGYQTHLIGKWHLGYYDWKFTPILRGAFDYFFGYLNGYVSYYDHTMNVGVSFIIYFATFLLIYVDLQSSSKRPIHD